MEDACRQQVFLTADAAGARVFLSAALLSQAQMSAVYPRCSKVKKTCHRFSSCQSVLRGRIKLELSDLL